MSSDSKILSFEDVSNHNKKDDCWLIIGGKVYDMTPFLDDHPGGDEVLLLATAKDATDEFEDVGHSQSARDMMKDYYVGEIDSSTFPQKKQFQMSLKTSSSASNQDSSSSSMALQIVLPLLILALAFALYYFAKKE